MVRARARRHDAVCVTSIVTLRNICRPVGLDGVLVSTGGSQAHSPRWERVCAYCAGDGGNGAG